MRFFRKCVIVSHRYLGIAFSLLVIMWFASGITMMYVGGMPAVAPQKRLDRLPALDLARVKLSPDQAATAAKLRGPARPTLLTVMDRPVYRFGGRGGATTVFADTGDVMEEATLDQSRAVAAHFANVPIDKVSHLATLEEDVDQWTLGKSRQLPFHKFAVNDGEGTELYVQTTSGEVAMETTSRTRFYAWISTIPHWLYFTGLKTRQPLWYKTVVYTSEFACVVSFLGIILGFTQARWSAITSTRPLQLSKAIPYSGWMRWHYITGVIFGVFTLTWAFSGLLSMESFDWTNARGLEIRRDVFTGGPLDLKQFTLPEPSTWARVAEPGTIKEIDFQRIQDEPYFIVHKGAEATAVPLKRERLHQPYNVTGRAGENRLMIAAKTMEPRRDAFTTESIISRLEKAAKGTAITEQTLLTDYDDYYYSRGRLTPLPVLRVKFADPMQTWYYIDPADSQMLTSVHRYSRIERWLYNGLHSLDFAFWYNKRPLWDLAMIILLTGGLASSVLGLVMGIKRMRRATMRAIQPRPMPAKSETPLPVAGD